MGQFLDVTDLLTFAPDIDQARAADMIDDAEALAVLAAPCILTVGFAYRAAVRAILRAAVLRWNEAGTGAFTQRTQTAGSVALGETYDTRQQRKGMFWPSEIEQLQGLCSTGNVYTVSLAGPDPVASAWDDWS